MNANFASIWYLTLRVSQTCQRKLVHRKKKKKKQLHVVNHDVHHVDSKEACLQFFVAVSLQTRQHLGWAHPTAVGNRIKLEPCSLCGMAQVQVDFCIPVETHRMCRNQKVTGEKKKNSGGCASCHSVQKIYPVLFWFVMHSVNGHNLVSQFIPSSQFCQWLQTCQSHYLKRWHVWPYSFQNNKRSGTLSGLQYTPQQIRNPVADICTGCTNDVLSKWWATLPERPKQPYTNNSGQIDWQQIQGSVDFHTLLTRKSTKPRNYEHHT